MSGSDALDRGLSAIGELGPDDPRTEQALQEAIGSGDLAEADLALAFAALGSCYHAVDRQEEARDLLEQALAPQRLALALAADGWLVRNVCIWAKPNPLPQSARDRLSPTYEVVIFATKQRRYFFDLDPIRVAHRSGNRRVRRPVEAARRYQSGNGGLGALKARGLVGKNQLRSAPVAPPRTAIYDRERCAELLSNWTDLWDGEPDVAQKREYLRIAFDHLVAKEGRLREVVLRKATAPLFLSQRGCHSGSDGTRTGDLLRDRQAL